MFIIPGNVISPSNVITSTSAMCIGTNVSHWHDSTFTDQQGSLGLHTMAETGGGYYWLQGGAIK